MTDHPSIELRNALRDHLPAIALPALSAALCLVLYGVLNGVILDDVARGVVSVAGAGLGIGVLAMRRPTGGLGRGRDQRADGTGSSAVVALRDPLTALGNHRAFREELQREVSEAQRYGVPLSLVLIDIDEFSRINDEHGLAGGDRALATFGRMVVEAARSADRCFRTGGDEFALILPHTEADGALVLARRVLLAALEPDARMEQAVPLSFSAGISSVPLLATTGPALYAQAQTGLAAAKRAGGTDIVVFDPANATPSAELGTGDAVAELIAHGRLAAAYQPIIDLASGSILGWEGLIRPMAPTPFPDPVSLLAAAEAGGQLTALDFACLETIMAGAADLPADAFLSINLSPQTLEAPEFTTAALLGILERHGLAPSRLVIELTEGQPIGDVEKVLVKLDTFRRAGIRLAADDLGAGNAGLRLLTDLRFDIVKVDLALVHRTAPGGRANAVVESIVAYAVRTGALVVGEGVESADQLDQLLALGVPAAQGFLLGHPGPLSGWAKGDLPQVMAVPEIQAAARADEEEMLSWRRSLGLPPSPLLGSQ